jgi:hypothetical protein
MAPRNPTQANPGNWYVCSGESPIALAQGPGTFKVASDPVSTIDVVAYDSAANPNETTIPPNQNSNLNITGGLFLKPNPGQSGTAEGTYYKIPPAVPKAK